jgi:hypothetical protein
MYKNINIVLSIIVIILIIYYLTNTMGREEMTNGYTSYEKWIKGDFPIQYDGGYDYDDAKLKDFVPKKTSPLKALCNHEERCMSY